MKHRLFATTLALFTSLPAMGFADQQSLVIEQAWSRASMGNGRPGVVYLVVRNNGDEARTITGIKTDIAATAQIHRTTTSANGVSQMAPAGDIEILPGEELILASGGLHGMLMGLTEPLVQGESYALTLVFENGKNVEITVPILSPTARGPGQ